MPQKKSDSGRPSRDREVKLSDGYVIKMRPLPLNRLPVVADSFTQIFAMSANGASPLEILAAATDAVIKVLQECIIAPDKELILDAADAPCLLEVFIDQNVRLDQWHSLFEQIKSISPGIGDKLAGIAKDE